MKSVTDELLLAYEGEDIEVRRNGYGLTFKSESADDFRGGTWGARLHSAVCNAVGAGGANELDVARCG